jgi:hypothetical protein
MGRWFLLLAFCALGCRTARSLEVTSTPPGAQVRLDGESIGTTPLKISFEHYGTRRLTFYLSGYRTQSARINLKPPWYARFPLDLVTEVLLPLGLDDRRKYHQDLIRGEELMSLPSLRSVIERARVLRESGPEGPRELPEVSPAVVPPAPAEESTPPDEEGPEPKEQRDVRGAGHAP